MPAPDGFRVTQQVPGGEPVDLTRQAQSVSWSSSVPGGFGTASLTLPRVLTQKERGLLGGLTIEHEGRVLFDGRIEDAFFKGSKASVSTDLNAFGYQRLLTDNSVRRIWSLRDLPVQAVNPKGSSSTGTILAASDSIFQTGTFTPTSGIAGLPVVYNGIELLTVDPAINEGSQAVISLPPGLAGVRLRFHIYSYGGDSSCYLVHSSSDGSTWTRHLEVHTPGVPGNIETDYDVALLAGATDVRITAGLSTFGVTGVINQGAIFTKIRILGTQLNEDADGGWYGGTILRDLIQFAPGLYPGTIEDGSDFVISEMQRVNRTSLLDVVQQIDPLYAREWGVWEAGRFDWITPDLAAGGWLIPLGAATEWSIEQSIDAEHKRTYVTFQDAADGQLKEAYVDSTNARNPYVRTGANKDGVIAAPAAMTSITAPFLAAKLNNDFGRWPDIKGSLSLPAQTVVAQTGNGSRTIPAFAIRAGDNITVPDLPVEDIYASGQDGQTVFHVTGVQASTDGNVQLTLEGLTRRADVLLARLGAISQ